MARSRFLPAFVFALACCGQGAAWAGETPPAPDGEKVGIAQHALRGLASWYGARFQGRRTASGALFDKDAMTAAHPTLPFGTRVQVRNLATGRVVEVRITDRGPHVRRRIIDLSQAAARAIGIRGGVAQVRLTVLDPEPLE